MYDIVVCRKRTRSFLAFAFLLLLLPLSSVYTNFQSAYGETLSSDQVMDKIKQLDSDLKSQFQLLNPVPMDFEAYSGIVWQTQDSSFTFSVDALKGDQGQRQTQYSEFMKISSDTKQSTTISGHPGWIEAYNNYNYVWVDVRWGDGNYFSPLAEFTFTIPSSIKDNSDSVKTFLNQKQKDVIDIVTKIDAVITQHGFYNFGGQVSTSSDTQASSSSEITGTITSIRSGAILSISRADGSLVDASVGLVLHKGDTIMSVSNESPFVPDAIIDFGYGKLEVMQSTTVSIDQSELKDNLAKTQLNLKNGSIYQIIDGPIEAKYHKAAIRSDFSVITPTCSASIRGSAMFVSYDSTVDSTTVFATQDQAFVKGISDSREIAVQANQKVKVGSEGIVSSPLSLTSNELATIPGVEHQVQLKIPGWVKNDAGWWAKGEVSDDEFVKGMQYLITNAIMEIPSTQTSSVGSHTIPGWVKNDAGWWAGGQVSDDEFVKGIQFLITNGIVVIGSADSHTQVQTSASQQTQINLAGIPKIMQSTQVTLQLSSFFKMDKSQYVANGNPNDMATISGKVDNPKGGSVILTITKPDRTTESLTVGVTNVGNFRTVIIIDDSFPAGTYTVGGNYQGSDLGSATFMVK